MNDLSFDGRVAIVTGAGRGIGRSYAMLLASRGARVVVNDLGGGPSGGGSSRQAADDTVAEILAKGGEAVANFGDVSLANHASALISQAMESFGRIDIVINNAGIQGFVPFAEMTLDQFDLMLRVHTVGTFQVTRAAWPHMVKHGYGRVVMTCSAVAFGMAEQAHYSTAKGGIFSLVRVLSLEGQPHGINVNAIIPSASTRLVSTVPAHHPAAQLPVTGLAIPPIGGAGVALSRAPDLVAPAVGWLVHETCSLTGETLYAAAGFVGRVFVGITPGYFNPDLSIESVRDNWPE
ncbi:MAG: SDR family NAD(P)-dependent oxidoreductase, partial [Dehalococcoidia bacterium]|nr:SDR family NAD(P)-dependent oxidoreductase [Dehalococcoidia bacterium]